MRRTVAGSLIVATGLAVAAAAAAGSGAPLKVTVKPHIGGPRTRFVVRFRAPARTGVIGLLERRYQIEVRGIGTGCAKSRSSDVRQTRRGQLVSLKLSGPWCAATYHGKLVEIEGPYCRPGQPCPEFATRVRTIARFGFMVVGSLT